MEIEISYDSISFLSSVKCSSATVQSNLEAEIKNINGKRITEWFESFLGQLKEENNYEPFLITIKSCDDYEEYIIKGVLKNEENIQYNINVHSKEKLEEKYQLIDNFIDFVLKSEDEIVDRAIHPHIKNIEQLRCNKVEVPVIATMSSGKSTLLNALIGNDFLHEDTGATTATTCTIKVNNKLEHFTATVYNKDEKESTKTDIAEFIKEKNKQSNENQSIKLYLEGPVSGIDTRGFDFRFIDTPGPNSARNGNHKEKTYEFLKDNQNLPIVLYVLDPEKMDSKDDDSTLKEIGEILKDNKQNLERIIFIYNKIDRENIEEKSLKNIIEKVVKFLEDYGITTPKIFPVSAEYAKFAQLEENLSRNEKGKLGNYRHSFYPDENYKGYELLEHSSLTTSQKEILQKQINNGGVDADLVYSGLAALKLYLGDYVTNHHLKNQYKELQSIISNVSKQIRADIKLEKKQLEKDSEEQHAEQKKQEVDEINSLKNKKQEVEREVKDSKIDNKFIKLVIADINRTFDQTFDKVMRNVEISEEKSRSLVENINAVIENLQISIKTTIESKMNDEMIKYTDKLKNIVANRFEVEKDMNSITINSFSAEMINNISSINLNQVEEYINRRTEKRTREVKRRTLLGQFFLGSKREEYLVTKTVVDVYRFYNEQVTPRAQEFDKAIENCVDYLKKIETQVKEQFNRKIDEIFSEAEKRVYKTKTEFISKVEERKKKEKYYSQLEKKIQNINYERI